MFSSFGGIIISSASASIQFSEFQITSNGSSQENPDISCQITEHPGGYSSWPDLYIIVYQDNRNGNWDIYTTTTFGPGFKTETRITNSTGNQVNPKIFGDKIVWQDNRDGNWNIYMYDLTKQTESQITNNTLDQGNPAIFDDYMGVTRIVWQDNRNGNSDIYMYDLSTHSERRLTSSGVNVNPAIYDNRVVYIRRGSDGLRYLYCFDLSTGKETLVATTDTTTHGILAERCAISWSRIVWTSCYHYITEYRSIAAGYDVRMQDLATSTTWISNNSNSKWQTNPDISGNNIVYENNTNGIFNICLYSTESHTEYRVSNNSAHQEYPAVFGGNIVYMDNRNGNWDIYMTMISSSEAATLGGAAQSGTQNEQEITLPTERIMAIAIAIIVIVVASIIIVVYLKKHKNTISLSSTNESIISAYFRSYLN